MQEADESLEFNVRASGYFIARATGTCRACQKDMTVIAVGVCAGHERLECDESEGGDDSWTPGMGRALLFYVERLPAAVVRRCLELSASFKLADDPAAGTYWANHCVNCGALARDHELFCEPESAFLPMGRTPHGLLLAFFDEEFTAAAAGDVADPEFPAHAWAR